MQYMVSAESSNHSIQTQFPRELNLEKVCSTFDNKTVISAPFKEMRITGNKNATYQQQVRNQLQVSGVSLRC